MHPALQKNLFLVKEQVGLFKVSNSYDVFDPQTGELVLQCREPNLSVLTQFFRWNNDWKRATPFDVHVTTPEGELLLRVARGIAIFLSHVDVFEGSGDRVGGFKQKMFSIGGSFNVLDDADQIVCTLKGKWTGWDFKFEKDGQEFARVTKKWSGLGKEMFTSADNYMLEINGRVPPDHPIRLLIMGAIFCIDMVLKE